MNGGCFCIESRAERGLMYFAAWSLNLGSAPISILQENPTGSHLD
jgi:hypothetical protein